MAKKIILKDLDNIEILPITRGELVLDSSGKEAFHSNEFLATNSLPGLMSPEEKTKLSTITGNTTDSTLSTTSVNPVQNKVITVAINEAKQLANDALETANDASENVSKVQKIINGIKESYLKSATVNGNVLTIVDLSNSEITFTNTTYNTFLKETATNTGGRNGLVPKPNYNDGSKTRFLREDGTWVVPTDNKVLLGVSTNSKFRCLLLGTTQYESQPSTPSEVTGLAYITKNIYVDPSKATLYADTFVGNLTGNATTATSAQYLTTLDTSTDDTFVTYVKNYITNKGINTWRNSTGGAIGDVPNASTVLNVGSDNSRFFRLISLKSGNLYYQTPISSNDGWNTRRTILDSVNSYIKDGVITINGTSITPFTARGRSEADWNTVKTNGTYYVSSLSTNRPALYGQMIVSHNGDTTAQLYIGFSGGTHRMFFRGWSDNTATAPDWITLLDSSNYTDYTYSKSTVDTKLGAYLPLSGGTITSEGVGLTINRTHATNPTFIRFSDNGNTLGYLGVDKQKYPVFHDGNITVQLIHSGNIGSQSVSYATSAGNADTLGNLSYTGYMRSAKNADLQNTAGNLIIPVSGSPTWNDDVHKYGVVLQWCSNYTLAPDTENQGSYYAQLYSAVKDDGLYYRRKYSNNDWRAFKQIAFTDSNITGNAATATQLKESVTLWGKSFDGSGNVSGSLTGVGNITSVYRDGETNPAYRLTYDANALYLQSGNGVMHLSGHNLNNLSNLRVHASKSVFTGNVLINTDTDNGYKLDVNGTFRASGNATFDKTVFIGGSRLYRSNDVLLVDTGSTGNNKVKASIMQVNTTGVADDIDWAFAVTSQGGSSVNTVNSGVGIYLGGYASGTGDSIGIGRGAGITSVAEDTWYNYTGIAFYVNHGPNQSVNQFTEKLRLTYNGNLIPKYNTSTQSLGSSDARWVAYLNSANVSGNATIGGTLNVTDAATFKNNTILNNSSDPNITFKDTAASHELGKIYYVTAYDSDNKKYKSGRFLLRLWSYTADTTTKLNYYEDYSLPSVTTGLTSNRSYTILTTKNYSSYLGYIGTTAVQASSANQSLTGITNLTITATDVNSYIKFSRAKTDSDSHGLNYILAPTNGLLALGVGSNASNYITAIIDSASVRPYTTGTKNLGTNELYWKNTYTQSIYISGSASSTAYITANSESNLYFTISNKIPLVLQTTEVRPGSGLTNLVNLGTSSVKWKNVYATTFNGDLTGNATSATKINIQNIGTLDMNTMHGDDYRGTVWYGAGGNSAVNNPVGDTLAFGMLIWRNASGYTAQLIMDSSAKLRVRLYTGSAWSALKTFAFITDITKSQVGLGNVQNTAFYKRLATVNGTTWDLAGTSSLSTFTIYAPTTAGTSGQVLTSSGGTPSWVNQSSLSVGFANNSDKLDGIDSTGFLRQVVVPNNTENDFNTFSNMTLTGRLDPKTGASLINAPWTGKGPAGGYGVLTYLFNGTGYGTQMAWGYYSNRIYVRSRYLGGSDVGIVWSTSWDSLALTSDLKNPSDYYWANIKVSASSNNATSPTFATATATTSVTTPLVTTSGILTLNGKTNIYLKINNTDFLAINFASTYFKPFGSAKNLIDLGTSDARWKGLYSCTGNFSSTVTSTETIQAHRYCLKYAGIIGVYADLLINTRGTACTTEGTAGTTGITYLLLGNNTAVSTTAGSGAENALGILRIYGSSSGYTNIRCGTNNTSNYTLYLPGGTGLFVYHTNDTLIGAAATPVYITSGGAAMACTISAGSGNHNRPLMVTNGSNGMYYIPTITGNYATGSLISTATDTTDVRHTCANSNGAVSILASSNRGLYDATNSAWIVYLTKTADHVYVPKWASKGSVTLPVYFNNSGEPVTCTAYSGLLTDLTSTSTNKISLTVGGTTKTLTTLYASYLTSIGTVNPQTGRTLNYGHVYSYNTNGTAHEGAPTTYTSVIGFGRGTSGTVEIAGGWTSGMGLWYRALRDTTDDWYNWVKVLDSTNSSVSGGGSSWGSSITVKINGTTKTLTIPNNPNTDSLVQQSKTTTDSKRPILMGYTQASAVADLETDVTNKSYVSSKIYAVPNTGTLYATTFSGNLAWDNITGKPSSYYSLPLAASGTRGGIQIGYTDSGANIALKLSSEKGYVTLTKTAVTTALGYTPPSSDTNTWRPLSFNSTSYSGSGVNFTGGTGISLSVGAADSGGQSTVTISPLLPKSGSWFNDGLVKVSTSGVTEIGRYIDFHPTNTSTLDYSVRIDSGTSTTARTFTLGTTGGTLAIVADNNKTGNTTTTSKIYPVGTTSTSTTADNYAQTYTNINFYVNSSGVFWTSDRKFKDCIKSPVKNGMLDDETGLIRKFNWKDTGKSSYGFIAQELLPYVPEAVDYDEELNKYSVNYDVAHSALIAQLIIKVKELEEEILRLKQLIN